MSVTFKEDGTKTAVTTMLKGRSPFKDGVKFSVTGHTLVNALDAATGVPITREDGTAVQLWVLTIQIVGKTKEHWLFPTMAFKEKTTDSGPQSNGGTFFKLIEDACENDALTDDKAVCEFVANSVKGKIIAVKRNTFNAKREREGRLIPCVVSTLEMNIL